MPFVLVVEDDPALGAGLEECFRREHFDVHLERDGAEGLAAARDRAPDCIVLDVMLPGMNGFDLVRTFRAGGGAAPVLFLTARAEEADRVLGLEMGGDDYLVKPFSNREMIARVRALLRRARRPEEPAGQIACAGFVLEPEAGVLTLPCGRVVELARYETEILRRLFATPGKVVPRSRLLDEIWGWAGETTTRVVDFHVGNLRRKVEPDPARPTHILTAHGRGYRWAGG